MFSMLPTGAGKSVLYQCPAFLELGVALVVSPLLSLMSDQVRTLQGRGVKATRLGSDLGKKAEPAAIAALWAGELKLLYLSPERLLRALNSVADPLGNVLDSLASRGLISSLVVDEAHCVVDWGTTLGRLWTDLGSTLAGSTLATLLINFW